MELHVGSERMLGVGYTSTAIHLCPRRSQATGQGDGLAAPRARLGLAVPPPALQKAWPMLGAPHPVTSGGGAQSGFGACSAPSLGAPGWSWVSIRTKQSGAVSPVLGEHGGASSRWTRHRPPERDPILVPKLSPHLCCPGFPEEAGGGLRVNLGSPCCLWADFRQRDHGPHLRASPAASSALLAAGWPRLLPTHIRAPSHRPQLLSARHCWHAVWGRRGTWRATWCPGPLETLQGPGGGHWSGVWQGRARRKKNGTRGFHFWVNPGGLHGGDGMDNSVH